MVERDGKEKPPERPDAAPGEECGALLEGYRACIDALPDLICLKDEGLRYLIANRQFRDAMGLTGEEVVGRRADDLLPKEIARIFERMDLTVLATGKQAVEEVRIGEMIYEVGSFPATLGEGAAVATSLREVTRRKSEEEALVREKNTFQTVAENAPFGMMLADQDGTVSYVNRTFKQLFGYDLDDIPDRETWFRRVLPEVAHPDEVFSTWMKGPEGGPSRSRGSLVQTVVCKDGTARAINFAAVHLATGELLISCEDVTEFVDDEKRALHRASNDGLTGLPNRSSLEKAVRSAVDHAREGKKRGSASALLFMDIDDFKSVNDTFGRASGDEVLITLAKLLKSILRAGDYVYRFGDDQFVVLFRGISLAEASLAARRIQKTINQHKFSLDYREVRLDVALGLVQIDGSEDGAAVLSHGVLAMGKAKTLGHNQLVHHAPAEAIVPD
jgi:diguanylate cyclase (GGDEF)-like protein/PAS domain S-box-containing protein